MISNNHFLSKITYYNRRPAWAPYSPSNTCTWISLEYYVLLMFQLLEYVMRDFVRITIDFQKIVIKID